MNDRARQARSAILDEVARERIPDDANLAPRILAHIQERKHSAMRLQVKMLAAVVIALLIGAGVLIGVPGAAEAMQKMLGRFIPGVGIMEISDTRMLAEPVTVTRDGIIVTVNSLVADTGHILLDYTIDGLTELSPRPDDSDFCQEEPRLRLPDGSERTYMESTSSPTVSAVGKEALHHTVRLPGLPPGASELTLAMPCLKGAKRGTLPTGLEIPLHLVAAPPDLTSYPVIEIVPTATPTASVPTASAPEPAVTTPTLTTPSGFSLSVDRAIPLGDGFRLYGRLRAAGINAQPMYITAARLVDDAGQTIPGECGPSEEPGGTDFLSFACDASGEYPAGPVTLVIDTVDAHIFAGSEGSTFSFDAGEQPQVDQVWTIGQDLEIGGYPVHVDTVRLIERDGTLGFNFRMSSPDPAVHSVIVLDTKPNGIRAVSSTLLGGNSALESEILYNPEVKPSGPTSMVLSAILVTLHGPWQLTITLPAAEGTGQP